MAVERTKPSGRIIGIDIIPTQPPKGVSTIQGNFLTPEVQAEVRRFVADPDRGRIIKQEYVAQDELSETEEHTDIDGLRTSAVTDDDAAAKGTLKRARKVKDEDGKTVDIVLSDMCEPWPLTDGYWKRSLSDPYFRMMNTSGISFKDHAGSMVGHA